MKWKNEVPNKFEFMKINSHNFIVNEKLNSELEHEKNLKFLQQTQRRFDEEQPHQEFCEKKTESGLHLSQNYQFENFIPKMNSKIEQRLKYIPAKIKKSQNDNNLLIQSIDKNVKVRIMSETVTLTQSKTDFTGAAPRRYTTTCFIKPITAPIWYTESLFLTIGSTKRTYTEQVYFKNRLYPFYWSENMQTEVKTNPKCIVSEFEIPVDGDEYHYLSLIPQQPLETTSL